METEALAKLANALNGDLSEAEVVYILSMIRKMLDSQSAPGPFFYLRFFCDWAFHARVDRSGAKRVLHHFDDWFPALVEREDRAEDGCRFLLLFGFHLEFRWLLRELHLPEISDERWCTFLQSYLGVIAGSPVCRGADLGLKHIDEVAVERFTSGSSGGYCWNVTTKAGNVVRIPLDPTTFFRVRPTHTGEPWLWKGPVAAMVGLPEGWVADNDRDPGYQFCMHSVLQTREMAMKEGAFLYGIIILKSPQEPTMEAIADRHEREIFERAPCAKFERLPPLEGEIRADGHFPRTLLRVGHIQPSYGGPEYSLYVDSPKGVLLLVLLCPQGKDDTYLPALKWVGRSVIMMTREDDTFIELEERAAICNRAQGDVYVSVHANSSPSRSTTGSEIYFVDDKGEYTAVARGVAAARTMEIAPKALGCDVQPDFISKEILFGALLEEYRIESRELASCIIGPLGGNMISYGRGIYGNKGLRVLRFTRCPGVLVEVGFLSNPQSEQTLAQEYYRQQLAESISEGLMRFKAAQEQTAWTTR